MEDAGGIDVLAWLSGLKGTVAAPLIFVGVFDDIGSYRVQMDIAACRRELFNRFH